MADRASKGIALETGASMIPLPLNLVALIIAYVGS